MITRIEFFCGMICILVTIAVAEIRLGREISKIPTSMIIVVCNETECSIETKQWTEQEFVITAYCPCKKCCGKNPDHPAYKVTASGFEIIEGDKFVAAPKLYPFHTIMEIPGYGKVPVLDRGGAIKGNKLDVYFDTHQEALEWEVQTLNVKVYK